MIVNDALHVIHILFFDLLLALYYSIDIASLLYLIYYFTWPIQIWIYEKEDRQTAMSYSYQSGAKKSAERKVISEQLC